MRIISDRLVPLVSRLPVPGARFALFAGALFLAVLNTRVTPSLYAWEDSEVIFRWIATSNVTMTALAAGYALGQRDPLALRIGVTALFISVYMVNVASGYDVNPTQARHASEWAWWAIPAAIAFWARTAATITSVPGLARRPLLESALQAISPWLRGASRREAAGSVANWLRRVGVWLFAAVFAVVGSFPGVVYRIDAEPTNAWNGRTYSLLTPYWFFAAWAALVFAGTLLMLERAWRSRKKGLRPTLERYIRYSLYAARLLILAAALLLFQNLAEVWPEAQVDLLVAVAAVAFVLTVVEAGGLRRPRRLPSARRRLAGGVLAASFVLALIAILDLPAFHASLMALVIGFSLPLYGHFERSLYGWPEEASSQPLVPPPVEPEEHHRVAMRDLLVKGAWPKEVHTGAAISSVIRAGLRAKLDAALKAFEDAPPAVTFAGRAPRPRHVGIKEPLRALILALGAPKNTKPVTPPDHLLVALVEFPVLTGDVESRLQQLVRLVYDSTRELRAQSKETGLHPSRLRMVEVECARRLDDEGDPEIVFLQSAYGYWRDRRATWAELEETRGDVNAFHEIRERSKGHIDISRDTPRRLGRLNLAAGCDEVLAAWRQNTIRARSTSG